MIELFEIDGFCAEWSNFVTGDGLLLSFLPMSASKSKCVREYNELRREFLRKKIYNVVESWLSNWWQNGKKTNFINKFFRINFSLNPVSKKRISTCQDKKIWNCLIMFSLVLKLLMDWSTSSQSFQQNFIFKICHFHNNLSSVFSHQKLEGSSCLRS